MENENQEKPPVKFEDLSKEQQNKIKKVIFKYYLKSLWNGISHGLLALLMSAVAILATNLYFGKNFLVLILLSAIIYFFIFNRIRLYHDSDFDILKQELEQIIKK